ncbi:hypothetical protein Tco_1059231, partial [Tanacetum coccineum]
MSHEVAVDGSSHKWYHAMDHKKFFNRGVIVVENEPDIIHLDNSSDLPPSTSGND